MTISFKPHRTKLIALVSSILTGIILLGSTAIVSQAAQSLNRASTQEGKVFNNLTATGKVILGKSHKDTIILNGTIKAVSASKLKSESVPVYVDDDLQVNGDVTAKNFTSLILDNKPRVLPTIKTIPNRNIFTSTGIYALESTITIGLDGLPIMSYTTTSKLGLVKCTKINCSKFTDITIDSGSSFSSQAITLGSDGFPVISYFDYTNSTLKLVKCGSIDCATGNNIAQVDSGIKGNDSSIAIGLDSLPIIAYKINNTAIKVAKCGNSTCTTKNTLTQIATGTAKYVTAISIVISPLDGLPSVTYAFTDGLKVMRCGSVSCNKANSSVTIFASEATPSMTISDDGFPILAYAYNDVFVAKCTTNDCSTRTTTKVLSSTTLNAYPSIAIGVDGLPMVAYVHWNSSNNLTSVNIIQCFNKDCSNYNNHLSIGAMSSIKKISMIFGIDGLPIISYPTDNNLLTTAKAGNKFWVNNWTSR